MKNYFKYKILQLLPKNTLSRFIGMLANISFPKEIQNFIIRIFVKIYHINMDEAQEKQFLTFNHFFTRTLKPEARPIVQGEKALASPVDATIGCYGNIEKQTLFQAKGITYTLENLMIHKEYGEIFKDGFYITFYLSPKDYHRIHSPCDGKIKELFYIPGTLYPVNNFAVENIPGLFTINERLITLIEDKKLGKVAIVKVGATVVGKIKVVYDTIESNKVRTTIHKKYSDIPIKKGEEIGKFEMGSTVILFFEKGKIKSHIKGSGKEIHFGEEIAIIED